MKRPRKRLGGAFRRALPLSVLAAGIAAGVAVPQEGPPATASPHGELSISCQECHTPEGWRPLREPLPFDHSEATGFPLVAAHRDVSCLGCHSDLRFRRVGSACADCHADPHQRTLGFTCERCHAPSGWEERRRMVDEHATTLFPLTGAHAALDCAACHRGSPPRTFSGAPLDCFSCHFEDYRRTTNPNHARSGFPTECSACHDTASFAGADFRIHDDLFFPIFSGPHAGVWGSCSDCHTNPGNFAVFSCLSCHPRGEMDDEHDDVRGYRYESTSCLACHPEGRE